MNKPDGKTRKGRDEMEEIRHTVVRIQAGVLALVFAILGGLGIFIVTVWLLIKGGEQVGPNLHLLRNYFFGYSVSWFGSLVGLFYGIVVGGAIGWAIGKIYNSVANLRQR